MKKKVDVVIPSYNAENFIERTLRSVISQTYLPEKIIVVDDGSIDGTVTIVNDFKKNSPVEIELFKQENKGPNSARNVGLKNSRNEFVAFLDADDIWNNEKIEKQLAVFENSEYKDLGLVYCGYKLINENGEEINKKNIFPNLKGRVFHKLLRANLVSGSPSTVLIKRCVLEETGLFDESLKGSEDWDMWLRIAEKFQYDYVREPLIYVADLIESNSKNFEKMLINRLFFIIEIY